MQKPFIFIVCVFGLNLSLIAQRSCVLNSSGSFSGKTYTNAALGFSYTYPEGFNPQQTNLPTDPKGKSSILLALWKAPHDIEVPNLIVLADDPTQYADTTALGYLRRIENTVKHKNAKILSSTDFDLAGMKFYRLDYQFVDPDNFLNTSITGQIGKCEVSFEIRATTQPEIEKMVQSLKTVKLLGKKTP